MPGQARLDWVTGNVYAQGVKLLGLGFSRALLLACISLLVFAVAGSAADYEQNFDSLAESGWTVVDLTSSPDPNSYSWSQSTDAHRWYLTSHSGDTNSFVMDAPISGGDEHHSSDWLISPKFSTLSNGDVVSFFMRSGALWFSTTDSIELRLATGAACSPGTTPSSVGDFTKPLLTVDPSDYDGSFTSDEFTGHSIRPPWSEQAAVISGLPDGVHSGCLAIRHTSPWGLFVEVAIDDFSIEEKAAAPGDVAFFDNFSKGKPGWERLPYLLVRGRADSGSTVSLYMNSDCSGSPATTVDSDHFDWPGVRIYDYLPPNVRTPLSATSTDGSGNVSGCSSEGVGYFVDTIAPNTSDDVGHAGAEYPGAVKLTAEDSGAGVWRTFYTVGVVPAMPSRWSSAVYDPAAPPTLSPGQKISYFSVDIFNNEEEVKTSEPAPFTGVAGPGSTGATGADAGAGAKPKPSGDVSASGAGTGRVLPASRALDNTRGRVAIKLFCNGDRGFSPCSGDVSLAAALGPAGTKEKAITTATGRYSVAAGSSKVVKLTLSDAARRYAATRRNKTPWVRVVLTPSGTSAAERFRRKLFL
jgi:hypothetical protein